MWYIAVPDDNAETPVTFKGEEKTMNCLTLQSFTLQRNMK